MTSAGLDFGYFYLQRYTPHSTGVVRTFIFHVHHCYTPPLQCIFETAIGNAIKFGGQHAIMVYKIKNAEKNEAGSILANLFDHLFRVIET